MPKRLLTMLLLMGCTVSQITSAKGPTFVDPVPKRIEDRRQEYREHLRRVWPDDELRAQWIGVEEQRQWLPGSTITVAFEEPDSGHTAPQVIWARIEGAAQPWFAAANIAVSFVDADGNYLTWSRTDTEYKADVRISFAEDGYWSVLGNESANPALVPVNEPSMSLENFDDGFPSDGVITVLHEFGHALGLQHEHQHSGSTCEVEFQWEADPGYEKKWYDDQNKSYLIPDDQGRSPGVLLHFSNPPNRWPEEMIEENLFRFPQSHIGQVGKYDEKSIMKYHFEAFLFREREQAKCFTPQATTVSKGDLVAMSEMYPTGKAGLNWLDEFDSKVDVDVLSPELRKPLETLLERLLAAQKRSVPD